MDNTKLPQHRVGWVPAPEGCGTATCSIVARLQFPMLMDSILPDALDTPLWIVISLLVPEALVFLAVWNWRQSRLSLHSLRSLNEKVRLFLGLPMAKAVNSRT
jgi:hypothetical protein